MENRIIPESITITIQRGRIFMEEISLSIITDQ